LISGPASYIGWVSNGNATVDQYVAPLDATGITPSYMLTGGNSSWSRNLEQDFTYKTIEFWFMPNGGNAWLAFGTDSGGGGGMVLSLKSGTSSQNGLSDSQNFLYGDYGSVTNTFTEGVWYNIKIVTYDIGETPEWYVDGVLIEGDTALNYTLGGGTWFGIIHDGNGYCHFDNIRISCETPGTTPTFRSLVAADLPDISTLSNNGHTVSLGTDGNLTLPGRVQGGPGGCNSIDLSWDLTIGGGKLIRINPGSGGVASDKFWSFGPEGSILFPDLTVQTTAYEKVAVPITSKGSSGDHAGQVAFDSDYIYYCTASYDGDNNIWKRVALDATSWDNTPPPPPPTLVSIAITPANSFKFTGNDTTVQFTATGTYSDASTADITSTVTWESTPGYTNYSIDSTGLLRLMEGETNTTTITATLNGISDTTVLSFG
jgi:hypothetical protein